MSPVSRGRKGKKRNRSTRQPAVPLVFGVPEDCDCPSCTGEDADARPSIDELVASADILLEVEDALEAEIVGATIVSIGEMVGEDFEETLVGELIPGLEARATAETLAMLLAIASVAGAGREAAAAAADRLVEAGTRRPGWAADLGEPVSVGDCWRLGDTQGTGSVLACSFRRAGRSHALVISVDHLNCDAATDILLFDAAEMPDALEMMRTSSRALGMEMRQEALEAAEFRWQAERALDARAVHDAEGFVALDDDEDDEDAPPYPALAVVARTRMEVLPVPTKPAAPHSDEGDGDGLTELVQRRVLAQLAGDTGRPFDLGGPISLGGRTAAAKLPPKRKKSDRPAPVYQIKVGLRDAKPPIWRRLEVPADISLARLHAVIQVAFDWEDSHLHMFDTPYGEFGTADSELGHRAEAPVTLEQVARAVNSTIRYTYDFGDGWEHDIRVEKVLDRDAAADGARGRRRTAAASGATPTLWKS